jgi:formate dehydrogenase subunit gamma
MNSSIQKPGETLPAPATEIVRHTIVVAALHWLIAVCFILAMVTGLALYWASILKWMVPYFGGTHGAIAIHLVCGLGLALLSLPIYFKWRGRMRWTATDSHFVRHLREHGLRPDQPQPRDTGFFNGGQKLFFWAFIISTGYLLVTGLIWWWRREPWMPQKVYVVGRTSHRVVAVIMSGALLIHIYKATIGEPGTLASMLKGTVTVNWARLRRPGWFRELGGRE